MVILCPSLPDGVVGQPGKLFGCDLFGAQGRVKAQRLEFDSIEQPTQ